MEHTETDVERLLQQIMEKNVPLQQQLDEVLELAKIALPEDLLIALMSQRDIASGIVKQALKEGELVPDFTLPDAFGNAVTLSHLLKQGPVVITFYRGAWCPYCNIELHAYQQVLSQIQELGASLVAISPQTPDNSLSHAEKLALTFPVLSDAGNQVARQFRLVYTLDEVVRAAHGRRREDIPAFNGDDSWTLPIPATYLVDQTGIVRLAYVDPDYTRRLDPSVITARLKQLRDASSL